MRDLRLGLTKAIHLSAPGDGLHESGVPGVHCIKFSRPDRRSKRHWRASIGIVAQGCKEIVLGRDAYRIDDARYIVAPIGLPVTSRISSATSEKPFLALLIDFDPLIVAELAAHLENDLPRKIDDPPRAVFVGRASEEMLDAAIRLGRLFGTPDDAPVLGPLAVKEIFYYLLKGADGPSIRQFVRCGSKTHKVSQAVYRLKSELSDDVDVAALAQAANMSRSAFFKHFKEVTAMSPIQYQKRLRLLEARRLMIDAGETAEGSAYKVGYKSASQFSREYSRMFGDSPSRDAAKIRESGNAIQQF